MEKGLSPKRAKNILATLRRILVSAIEWEILETVPRFPKWAGSGFDFFARERTTRRCRSPCR